MAGKCKACHSNFLSEIDDRLRRGDTCESVAEWLNSQGLTVSATSINRHRTEHVDGIKTPDKRVKSETYTDMPPIVDIDAYIEDLTKGIDDIDVTTNIGKERKITQILLERSLQKQLVLVNQLQDNYAECKGSYPDSQIRGLKTLYDMVNALPTYEDRRVLSQLQKDRIEHLKNYLNDYCYLTAKSDSKTGLKTYVTPVKQITEYIELNCDVFTSEEKKRTHIESYKAKSDEWYLKYLKGFSPEEAAPA